MKPSRRVLVATDFSKPSDSALRLALRQIGPGGRIRLFHCVAPVMVPALAGPEMMVPVHDRTLTRHALASAGRHLAALAASAPKARISVECAESHQAADAIARAARRFKADLVCLSTHGRGGLSRLLFGSVAQKFLAHYRGAVLLYRPRHGKG